MAGFRKWLLTAFMIFNSYLAISQDINGYDYIRELKVKRASEQKANQPNYIRIKEFNDFKEPFEDEAKNSLENKIMNIHFQTNKSELTKNDSIDMNRYFMRFIKPYTLYEKVINFNIEGFADCRGDKWKNYELSNKRAESVANYLKKFYPNSRIYISAFGENESNETNDTARMQKDRKVRIFLMSIL